MKKCPSCAEEIQEEAVKCRHCGELLNGQKMSDSAHPKEPEYERAGTLLLFAGIAAAIYYAIFFDTSVAVGSAGALLGIERVNNIGLMQDKQNGLLLSVVAAVAGLVVVMFGKRSK